MRASVGAGIVLIALTATACDSETGPSPFGDFVVDVAGERFVVRASDEETIRLAEDNRLGRNNRFPIGTLRPAMGSACTSASLDVNRSSERSG